MPDGPVYFAYARPQPTDWHVVLAAPVAVLDRPWTRSLATLAAGGVAVLLVAMLLAPPAVRPITGSVSAPAGRPPAPPARRRPPPPPPPPARPPPGRAPPAPARESPGALPPASAPPASVTIVALDATGRRAALDAARAGDTRFRVMADAAPVLVWLAAPDARRTWFNSQWLDFVGHRLGGEIGAGSRAPPPPPARAPRAQGAPPGLPAPRPSPLPSPPRPPQPVSP